MPDKPNTLNIAPFYVDAGAWTSRTALYRVAVAAAQATDSRVPSPQEVYAALRARGFGEAKRRGVWGFKGLRPPEDTESGRLVPAGTAAAYYKRGDRSDAAKEAVAADRAWAKIRRQLDEPMKPQLTPWFTTKPDRHR